MGRFNRYLIACVRVRVDAVFADSGGEAIMKWFAVVCVALLALHISNARAEGLSLKCAISRPSANINGVLVSFDVKYCGLAAQVNGTDSYAVTALVDGKGAHRPTWPSNNLQVYAKNMLICYNQSLVGTPEQGCAREAPGGLKIDKALLPAVELMRQQRWGEAATAMRSVMNTVSPKVYGSWPAVAFALAAPSTGVSRTDFDWLYLYRDATISLLSARKVGSRNAEQMLAISRY